MRLNNSNQYLRPENSVVFMERSSMEKLGLITPSNVELQKSKSRLSIFNSNNQELNGENKNASMSQIDIEETIQLLQNHSENSLDIHPSQRSKANSQAHHKLTWKEMLEEEKYRKDKMILKSLVDEGKIMSTEDCYLYGVKVDKTIIDLEGKNKDFFKFYKQKFSFQNKSINPFITNKSINVDKIEKKQRIKCKKFTKSRISPKSSNLGSTLSGVKVNIDLNNKN